MWVVFVYRMKPDESKQTSDDTSTKRRNTTRINRDRPLQTKFEKHSLKLTKS